MTFLRKKSARIRVSMDKLSKVSEMIRGYLVVDAKKALPTVASPKRINYINNLF